MVVRLVMDSEVMMAAISVKVAMTVVATMCAITKMVELASLEKDQVES